MLSQYSCACVLLYSRAWDAPVLVELCYRLALLGDLDLFVDA